jgi:two-component system, chemotaxis family, protein-glutamate methylesterase/glutaminase
MKEKVKVLIVDDSSVVRRSLTEVLSSDRGIEVMGTASDPFVAAEKIRLEVPDVILLDIEMPRMDGITFLHKVMSQHPIPVVICSSLTEAGAETTLKSLEYGAVEIILKPRLGTRQFIEESRVRICDAVKAASVAKIRPVAAKALKASPKLTADVVIAKPPAKAMIRTTEKVVVVGASTGGTEALRIFLESLPLDSPGIIIIQHMPEHFTAAFARRLDSICKITVKEAQDNDSVIRGRALIAPGNRHTLLKRSGARYFVEVRDGPLVCRHRPSVDVLFRSAARYAGKNAVGIIMTGMGGDGSKGMLEMKNAGAYNLAQDEASSVVFGMPQEAIKLGAVHKVLALDALAREVVRLTSK